MSPPTTEIYPLSLHDALPICASGSDLGSLLAIVGSLSATAGDFNNDGKLDLVVGEPARVVEEVSYGSTGGSINDQIDRKSTRLNSSHLGISYAVFCLKKKKKE